MAENDPQHIASPTVRHPPWGPIAIAAVMLAGLLLAGGASVLTSGWVVEGDRWLLLALRHGSQHGVPVGPSWLPGTVIDITALGSPPITVLVVAATLGFLATLRRWLTFWLVLGGTLSGSIVILGIKLLVSRPRPEVTDHLVRVTSMSFPSGHAASSAIVYLTIAAVLSQIVESREGRLFVHAAAWLLVLLIGMTRVYLGVHYPSDVIAGWTFGALWALAWWALGAALRLRRANRPLA